MKKLFTLLTLLALVANVGWATDYYIAHNAKLSSTSWNPSAEKLTQVAGSENLYSISFPNVGTDQVEFKITTGSWSTSYNGINNSLSDVTLSNSGNITFKLDEASDLTIFFDSNAEKVYVKLPAPDPGTISADLLAVLKGEKVMVYGGELSSWNQSKYYFMTSNSESSKVATANLNIEVSLGGTACKFGVATLPVGTYYQGHWASDMSCAIEAGGAYIVRGSSSSSYYTQKANSSSNYLYKVVAGAAPTTSVETTVPATVTVGGSISVSTSTAAGVSSLNKANSIKYYLYDGTDYSEVTLTDGMADVSSLAVGSGYKIVSVLYDGNISVRADEDEFSVVAAGSTSHSITYTTAGKWSYGEGKPTIKDEGETVEFTVTPNAGYTVSVSSEQVTLNKSENTYSFTMPATDVTINVSATAQYFGITYPATATNYTLSGHSETAATDEEVSFTVTPADGYKVSVTSEQATISKNGNNYSFTMPAKAVTVAIEATEIPMTTLYFWNKDSWSNVYVHMWDGNATSTTWPGKQLTTAEYKSDNHSVYKVSFEEGAYGKLIFNNNNNGQQTGDLSDLATHNGQCYYGKEGGWNALPEENWEVTISAENGTVESSKYVGATQKTVAATASDGYVFDKWEATGGVTIVDGTTATATVTVTAEGTLKAIFKADASKFSVNFSAVGGTATATVDGAVISNGANYTIGTPIDVVFAATPADAANTFYGWYDGDNNKISEENPYTVSDVNATYTIKAVYADKYYLKHPWNGESSWTVKEMTFDPATSLFSLYEYYGDNGFNYGTTTSTSGWNGGKSSNTLVGSPAKNNWCLITTPGNGTITVTKVTESHTLAASGDNATLTIKVNGAEATSALHMQPATFKATVADGYGFDGWYADAAFEQLVSEDAEYTVAVKNDISLYAKTTAETQYTITLANNVNSETSTLSAGATAKLLEAPSIPLYSFTNWTVEGDAVIADLNAANTTITATGTATVTAHYTLNQYFIKHANWNDAETGWGWKEATVVEGNTISLWAKYGGSGCNWNTLADDSGAKWVGSPTKVGDPQSGDCCKFTLDPAANTITITKIDDTPSDPLETRYYLYGSFNGWSTTTSVCFMKQNAEDNIATASLSLSSTDDVTFKIYKTGSCEWKYYGNDGTIDENTTFSSWWTIHQSQDNCTLTPSLAGTYKFELNLTELSIKVTFPEAPAAETYDIVISQYGYATLYYDKNLEIPAGVSAYVVPATSGTSLTLQPLAAVIPANTGVILEGAQGTYPATVTSSTETVGTNLLKGTLTDTEINNDAVHYILSVDENYQNVGLYWPYGLSSGVGAFTNKANRAYLEIPSSSAAPRRFVFRNPQTPTSLSETEAAGAVHKFIRNGQLFIQFNGRIFNAQGQIVK